MTPSYELPEGVERYGLGTSLPGLHAPSPTGEFLKFSDLDAIRSQVLEEVRTELIDSGFSKEAEARIRSQERQRAREELLGTGALDAAVKAVLTKAGSPNYWDDLEGDEKNELRDEARVTIEAALDSLEERDD